MPETEEAETEEQALARWLRPHIGAVRLRPAPGAHGAAQTWEATRADARWFVRWGRPARKHAQERRVAEELWPRLAGTPALVFADDRGLLMTACPGAASTAPEACRRAGALARRLHDLPLVDDDPLPLARALDRRLAALARRLARHGRDLPPLPSPLPDPGSRRWCHRDLSPDNWLWDGETCYLVDWEHARPDAPVLDLAKVAASPCWPDFARGYGAVEPAALRLALALHGAATLAWGLDHGDDAFVTEGERVLAGVLDRSLPAGG